MKKNLISATACILVISGIFITSVCYSQNQEAVIRKYLTQLPAGKPQNIPARYRMTAVYTNMDLYGNFTAKKKVTGDYTRGFENDSVTWENVFVAASNSKEEAFPAGIRQEYMEKIKYVPSGKMVQADAFKNFPSSVDNIFARNLIWDMLSFEIFAWSYSDSLKLNYPYIIPDIKGQFELAELGKYSHNKILLQWKGISVLNDELCAVIDFNAPDNIIELNMDLIKSKGTEQYWGTILVSMKTKNIVNGVMYSGTIQDIEVKGMKENLLMKTIRELEVTRIQ